MDKVKVISEIKGFLEGYNNELKYLVNVETNPSTNYAECVIHEPNSEPKIIKVEYESFMYMKDLSKTNHVLYYGKSEELIKSKQIKYGVKITKLKTANQKRLVNGFCYKLSSRKSYNSIINYLTDGGINPYEKLRDSDGNFVRNEKGDYVYLYRDLFHSPKTTEQFFISNQTRLYKGFEEYKNIHKLTFDIETTGLRHQISRVFAIGVRNNRGFEIILEVGKENNDEAEIKLIQDFFNLVNHLKPAVICGFNSEEFDFEFLLGRAKILKMEMSEIPTGLKKEHQLKRKGNTSVKYGNTADKYTWTDMWGFSVIDILHAAKKTAAINSDLKETNLKYVAKFEDVARPNRTYIQGEDNMIGRMYWENKIHLIDENNNYIKLPEDFQNVGRELYKLQANKSKITDEEYKSHKKKYLDESRGFVEWFKKEALPKNYNVFIGGKKLVKQYLLDDLWETEQIDELYNQSSFMLAKIVPTTYQRICTMGTAAIWNLLLTAWSYENDLAIPDSDVNEGFSGGLARCFKQGYTKRLVKIDYGSLYPMEQLEWNIFPIFDITGVIKKMLLYLTTTRNIYKKIAIGDKLNNEEVTLLRQIDHEMHEKYINNEIDAKNMAMAKIKQLPIKILNNSLFGALGSGVSFNWSDNDCASRITCTGRLYLRRGIHWFSQFGLVPLLAVTDGINFQVPDTTKIRITDDGVFKQNEDKPIEEMWNYGGKNGVAALIEKYNEEEMPKPFMNVDNDGESISCLNLSRINYATMSWAKNKKTGDKYQKIKLTGNTIKSKVMSEYIQDFIDEAFKLILNGKGKEFVNYYYSYAEDIFYKQIPLKKIASKSRVKNTISQYKKRGNDKNGREKGKQAHMELLIQERERIAEKLFQKHKDSFILTKSEEKLSIDDKMKLVGNYMPKEPELDSTIYYVNRGYVKSHGDSRMVTDRVTKEERYAASLISTEDLIENPNMKGDYNVHKYLDAFNKRVETILVGFNPEVQTRILAYIDKQGNFIKNEFTSYELELRNFNLDDFDEAMHLESKEVAFWNKTGYDPRLVWDGFKMYEDDKVHFEIYDNALEYLNELMTTNNKPRIKSINSNYGDGDLVLIKDGSEYHVGLYNGVYLQIIRENVQVPKSDIEIELDRKREEEEKRIENLESSSLVMKTERDLFLEKEIKFREEAFILFREKFGIPKDWSMEKTFDEIKKSDIAFEDFIQELKDADESDAAEYLDVTDSGDGEY